MQLEEALKVSETENYLDGSNNGVSVASRPGVLFFTARLAGGQLQYGYCITEKNKIVTVCHADSFGEHINYTDWVPGVE